MNIHPGVVGIDVSKHHLDVFDAKLGRSERLANTPAALVPKLAAWRESEAFVLFEATGSYDRALARMLVAAGIAFARVNPGRARDFARAAGFLAKTDAVDARMLAAMAQCLRPKAQAAAYPQREAMATLHKRRDQLVAARQQERTRKHECQDEDIAADLAAHLAFLDQAIARITQRIKTLIASSQTLEQAASLLTSVPGVGLITAATLLALMPELGNGTPKASLPSLASLPSTPIPGPFEAQGACAAAVNASAMPSTWPPSRQPIRNPASPHSTKRCVAPENHQSSPSSPSLESSSSPSMPSCATSSPSNHELKHSCRTAFRSACASLHASGEGTLFYSLFPTPTRLDQRCMHEVAEELAIIVALAGRLDQHQGHELLGGRDEEHRPRDAAPEELARR